MSSDLMQSLARAVEQFDRPWRSPASEVILARLQDILTTDPIDTAPMMYRTRGQLVDARDTYITRRESLMAMGWLDLTKMQRIVLIALCRDGLSMSEIARQSGFSMATIARVRIRALQKIALALADDEILARLAPIADRYILPGSRGPAGYIPFALRLAVYRRDRFTCLHCGTRKSLSVDHVHPFSKGGQTVFENLQTLCRRCNSRKGAKVPDEGGLQSVT